MSTPWQPGEREAIEATLRAAKTYGYGNLISYLQTAWALDLMESGLTAAGAVPAATGNHCWLRPDEKLDKDDVPYLRKRMLPGGRP